MSIVHNLEPRRRLSRFFAGVVYTLPANPREMVVCTLPAKTVRVAEP